MYSSRLTTLWALCAVLGLVSGLGYYPVDMPGGDLSTLGGITSDTACASQCDNNSACKAWAWDTAGSNTCWLKASVTGRVTNNNRVSGVKLGQVGVDRIGGDMAGMPLNLGSATAATCAQKCQTTSGCVAWAFDSCGKSSCWLKSSLPTGSSQNSCRTSAIQGTLGVDRPGNDIGSVSLGADATATTCHEQCAAKSGCTAWAFTIPGAGCETSNTCWFKTNAPGAGTTNQACRASGVIGAASGSSSGSSSSGSSSSGSSSGSSNNNVVSSGKIGLAWPDFNADNLGALTYAGKIKWFYTWSPWSFAQADSAGLEPVPMLWGPNSLGDWNNAVNSGVIGSSRVKAILGLNEPDNPGQANMSPSAAASFWKANIQQWHDKGKRLGSPAVESNPAGKAWLQQFFAACSGCTIDFIPLHWYGSNPNAFTAYVADMHNTFNKPVWVTEYACVEYDQGFHCDQNSVYSFLGQTSLWLDQQSYVERWAYFGAMKNIPGDVPQTNRLLTADGQSATPLGQQFATGGHS